MASPWWGGAGQTCDGKLVLGLEEGELVLGDDGEVGGLCAPHVHEAGA